MFGIGLGVGVGRSRFAGSFADAYNSRVLANGGTIESLSCVSSASTLLQQASLLFIPSGYKAGVAYSALPNSGNGDLTWSRNSTAYRTQSDGTIGSVAANVPRLSYMYGSCPAALLEPQRTNSIRNSIMQGAATGTPGTLPTNYGASTGGLTRSIVEIGTENGLSYIDIRMQGTATSVNAQIVVDTNTSNNASSSQTYMFSLYAKLVSGTANSYQMIWDEWSSTPTYLTSKSITVSLTSTLSRYTLTNSTAVSCATIQPFLRFILTVGNSYDFTIRIAQPQLELGAFATTPIFTSGTFATRLADTFTRNNIYTNGFISANGGTWYVELRNNVSLIPDRNAFGFWLGSSTTSPTALSTISFRQGGGSNRSGIWFDTTFVAYPTTDTAKIAIKWNGLTLDVFINGSKVSGSPFTFTPTISSMQNLIGDAGRTIFIQAMALFNAPLSDTDCVTLTT